VAEQASGPPACGIGGGADNAGWRPVLMGVWRMADKLLGAERVVPAVSVHGQAATPRRPFVRLGGRAGTAASGMTYAHQVA